MHIGLIGGIGVAATVVYYQRLTARMAELGVPLELTIVHGDVHELISNNMGWKPDAQAFVFARLVDQLRDGGADFAALTSLGAHFCFEETKALASLPLVSAIAPLDTYFADNGLKTVGLMGTANLMRSRFFGQLAVTDAVAPAVNLDVIGKAYQDMAVSGFCTDAQREMFFAAGREMIEEQDAEAVILAGTDLNLAFDGRDPGYPVIDALDVHVALLADLATGTKQLSDL